MATTRLAGIEHADLLAQMLHDFNTEFDVASPGVAVLAERLRALLPGDHTVALLVHGQPDDSTAGGGDAPSTPALGLALVTVRPNVWYVGQVALLDELYVVPGRRNEGFGSALVAHLLAWAHESGISAIEINVDEADADAQRFYERHGFDGVDSATGERAFYYSMEIG